MGGHTNPSLDRPSTKGKIMKLPKQDCPKKQKRDCRLCGGWLGWVDLSNPGRGPSLKEWADTCRKMQDEHDKARQREFDSLRII